MNFKRDCESLWKSFLFFLTKAHCIELNHSEKWNVLALKEIHHMNELQYFHNFHKN